MAETAQERQENELEALKAIFGAQLISTNECRTLDGSTWSPLECVLSLGPQQGSCGPQESQAFINIQIVCSEDYPEKAPQLFVQESKGLSTVQISQLQNDLKQLTEENRGEVVVYEVAHYIMTYLHRYSRPGFESFYDEMLARKRLQQQREAERRRAVESKKRQEMILEIQSKQEAMRLENNKRRKNSFIESDSDDESQNLRRKSESPVKKTVPITVEPIHSKETKAKEDAVENKSDSKDEDFCPWTFNSKGNSRIESEFLVLKWLGEGAFGDVIKARNKLDGCLYAIKRIKLSSTTNVLYRKITREVKLLSRLNHENVVRYFNSWIESASDSTENSSECSPKSEESKMVEMLPKKELTLEWSVGNEGVADGSSDDSSDDECWITFMPGVDDSSSSIAEESKSSDKVKQPSNGDCDSTCGRETEDGGTREKTDETSTNITPLHFMYIQMEFCEKSTLRNAIDEGLYLEEARVWRLLREIVEGLSHIHGQGIIHRDLKPVNIFIDCDDHVKIGDFGLATSNIFHSALKPPGEQGLLVGLAKNPVNSSSAQMGTALTSHTGQVGTALYVAPELNTFGVKASYDQKVDIYSLGVIFFEMCYHPVSTAMERLKILTDLRQPDCIFPSDFLEDKKPEQAHVIRWLLNHDACRRPSSQELLLSPLIPPPQLEDAQLQEMVRHTLSNPQSRAYKHLIAACFSQELSPAQDVTFDMSPTSVRGPVYSAQIEAVSESVRQVMRQHGAIYLPMPLLTPAAAASVAGESSSVVRLMSRWGGVLSAPYDLRQSFARHLAQNALVTRLKRYAIDRVYRERRVLGFHPRELYECAFDIVTPSSAPATLAAAEAELLFAARQIVGTRPGTCFIRLNHLCLVRAVLLHCGIDYSSHEKVCSLLAKTKLQEGGNSSRASAESALIGSDLAEQTVAMLLSLLTKEDSYERLSAWLRPLVQKKAKLVCQQGLLQLKQLIEYIGLLGVEWSVVVSLGLIYDLRDYSGVVFQVVWDQRGKHGRTERCVVAAGGRYDSMIHKLRQSLELGVPPDGTQQHAAGISLSLDKLVSVLSSAESGQKSVARRTVDVIVCAVGSTGESCSQRLKVLRELWASGICCSSIDEAENNNDDIQSVCFEMGASYVVYLKDGGCRIRNLSKDIARDKSQQDGWLSQSELVENLQRMMRTSPSSSNLTCSLRDSQMKAESRSLSEPSQPPVNVHFDVIDKMVNAAARRRLEIQVLNSVNGVLQKLSGRARVEILVLSLESEAVRLLASSVNVDRAQLDPSSVIKRFPRHKKYLERISERVQELTNTVRRNSAPVLVFYSIIDNSFQTVL